MNNQTFGILTILDEMVLGKVLEAVRGDQALREDKSNGDGQFILLVRWPAIDILQNRRRCRLFERLLEVLVPDSVEQMEILQKCGDQALGLTYAQAC